MNEFHLKIPTLNNVMNKFEYIYSAITLILRTCHRIKDSGKCLCFIKDKARETLAPLFIDHCLYSATTVANSSLSTKLGIPRLYLARIIKSLTND